MSSWDIVCRLLRFFIYLIKNEIYLINFRIRLQHKTMWKKSRGLNALYIESLNTGHFNIYILFYPLFMNILFHSHGSSYITTVVHTFFIHIHTMYSIYTEYPNHLEHLPNIDAVSKPFYRDAGPC